MKAKTSSGPCRTEVKNLLLLRDVALKTRHRRESDRDLTILLGQLKSDLSPEGRLQELIVEEMAMILFTLPRSQKMGLAGLHSQTQKIGESINAKIAKREGHRKNLERSIAVAHETISKFEAYKSNSATPVSVSEVQKEAIDIIKRFNDMQRSWQGFHGTVPAVCEGDHDLFRTGCTWKPGPELNKAVQNAGEMSIEDLGNVVIQICSAASESYQQQLQNVDEEFRPAIAELRNDLDVNRFPWEDGDTRIQTFEDSCYRRLEELHQELELRKNVRNQQH